MDRQGAIHHEEKYEAFAQALGIPALKALVGRLGRADDFRHALEIDPHLNSIPLHRWDLYHMDTRFLYDAARREGRCQEPGGWSMANSVCVLKHVAKFHVAGAVRTK